jgi:hypothetical protein
MNGWKFSEDRPMTAPDWLTLRGGSLKLGSDGQRWYVLFAGRPDYSLAAMPVTGKFGCVIRQTVNGNRIHSAGVFGSKEDAIKGGLDDLRKALGWA